jgi:hypothetical protein
VTSGVVSAFKKLHDSWGPRLEDTLRNAVFATVEQGGNLLSVMRLLGERPYREHVVPNIRDEVVRSFWMHEFASWSDNYRTEAVAAIQNKIRPFLTNTNMRAIVSQPGRTLDLRQVMDGGQVLIVNLSKGPASAASTHSSVGIRPGRRHPYRQRSNCRLPRGTVPRPVLSSSCSSVVLHVRCRIDRQSIPTPAPTSRTLAERTRTFCCLSGRRQGSSSRIFLATAAVSKGGPKNSYYAVPLGKSTAVSQLNRGASDFSRGGMATGLLHMCAAERVVHVFLKGLFNDLFAFEVFVSLASQRVLSTRLEDIRAATSYCPGFFGSF